jgi:hypothetical protein
MTKNVGSVDRVLRLLGALGAVICAVVAPLPVAVRVGVFGLLAAYMLFSAAAGTCFGYRLMGRSTCPAARPR